MIEEAIVHVGMHKTGSSSIQLTLSQLSMLEVDYLSLITPNHSGFLATLLPEKPEKHHSHVRNGRSVVQVKALKESYAKMLHSALRKVDKPRVIISAEYLSQPDGDIRELVYLRQILLGYCKRVRVIGYVRPPIGFMQSAFQQTLKGGANFRFNLHSVYPNYQQRFAKMDTVFGNENVHLIRFEKSSLHNGDVVQDFAYRVDVALPPENIVRTNESLSQEATALLYTFRHFYGKATGYKGFNRDNSLLIESLATLGSQKLAFSESAVAPVLEHNRKDIEWMSERLGVSIHDEVNISHEAIGSEGDLFKVADANRMSIWQLLEKTMPRVQNIQGLVQVMDQLYTIHAESISPLQPPPSALFSPSQLAVIATNNEPLVILNTLADALAKNGRGLVAKQVRKAGKQANKLIKIRSGGRDQSSKPLEQRGS